LVMWYSKPFRSVNIQRGVRESCCLRSGQLEHLSKINYPTQAIVQTKSPRIFELILCLIFSTTTGWSYPSASRATRPQESCLLHKTGSSWLFLGGSQTIHPTQTSPLLRRLCWDLWVPATGKAAPSWRRWAADGIPNDSAARKRNRCTYWQLPKRNLRGKLVVISTLETCATRPSLACLHYCTRPNPTDFAQPTRSSCRPPHYATRKATVIGSWAICLGWYWTQHLRSRLRRGCVKLGQGGRKVVQATMLVSTAMWKLFTVKKNLPSDSTITHALSFNEHIPCSNMIMIIVLGTWKTEVGICLHENSSYTLQKFVQPTRFISSNA